MRTSVILLVDFDGDSVGFVLEAAARTGHGVRVAKSASELRDLLRTGAPPVGAVIVDLEPAVQALALLDTFSASYLLPPLLLFSGMEETFTQRVTSLSCAVARLGKPLSIERLRLALEVIFAHDCEPALQRVGAPLPAQARSPAVRPSAVDKAPILRLANSRGP